MCIKVFDLVIYKHIIITITGISSKLNDKIVSFNGNICWEKIINYYVS